MIATSSDDKTVRLWDPDTGKEIHVFNEAKGFACHLDWHPSGTCIGNKNIVLKYHSTVWLKFHITGLAYITLSFDILT